MNILAKTAVSGALVLALAACATTPNAAQTQTAQTARNTVERNKANVLAFYELTFNRHKVKEAADKYIGSTYIQHNPDVADGAQAFVDAFEPFLKSHPQSRAEIKRVIAEGDLVMVHVFSKASANDKGEAVVDIFRLDENGKIVEHWDVIQPMPEKSVHKNGMF